MLQLYLLLFCSQTTFVLCTLIYTCPIGSTVKEPLVGLRENVLCNKTVNCDSLKQMFAASKTYRKNVILARTNLELWSDTRAIVGNLSECGIQSTVVQLEKGNNTNVNFRSLCSADKITVVLSWYHTNFTFMDDVQTKSTCILHDQSYNVVKNIITTCPNTAWIIGQDTCTPQNNYSSARIHFVDDKDGFFLNRSRRLKIASIEYEPFLINNTKNDVLNYSGVIIEMIEVITKKLNLSYDIYPSIDDKYGIKDDNDTWNGMMGMLKRKEVDMVAAALTMTESRAQIADFTAVYHFEPYGILVHMPKRENKLWSALSVFSTTTWIFFAVTAVVAILITYLIHRFSAKPAETGFEKLDGCVWYVTAGLVNQGGEIEPEAWSGRSFLAFWWLYIVIMIAVYGGLLVAQLSIVKTTLPFKDLHGLAVMADNEEYKFCLPDSTVMHEAVKKGKTADKRLLREIITRHPEFVRQDLACVDYMKHNRDVALIDELDQLSRFQKDNCKHHKTIILPDRFLPGYFGFALQKGWPLKDIISFEIREATEAGLISMWQEIYSLKRMKKKALFCEIPSADDYSQPVTQPMELTEFAGSFLILSMGVTISLITFFFERCRCFHPDTFHYSRPKVKKQKHNDI